MCVWGGQLLLSPLDFAVGFLGALGWPLSGPPGATTAMPYLRGFPGASGWPPFDMHGWI